MKQWALAVIALTLLVSSLFAVPASAHVLVQDSSKTKGAVLHVVPDDDPIAGEPATIFFDVQSGLLTNLSTVSLTITFQGNDTNDTVATTIKESLVTASYTFPQKGVYMLNYVISDTNERYTFSNALRVSRGVEGDDFATQTHPWAQGLLLGTASLSLMLGIIAWNRRKDIATRSSL